jgi:signal peptide peptidase SppA
VGDHPEKLELIDQIIVDRLMNGKLLEEKAEVLVLEAKGKSDQGPPWETIDAGKEKQIAIVHSIGVLSKRLGIFERISGGQSSDALAATAKALEQDSSISGVVLAGDSPGGQVAGTDAAAAAWHQLSKAKPVYAVANDLMASGMYWIASAASKIFVPRTAAVGSVGVVTMHFDRSKQMEKAGIRPTIIAAGKHKAAGNEFGPLDDESLKVIKERINAIYETFVEAVATHRGLSVEHVRDKIADGRVFTGRQAIELGAADDLGTLESVVAKLTGELSSASSRGVVLVSTSAETAGSPSATPATPATTPPTAAAAAVPVQTAVVTPAAAPAAAAKDPVVAERERCQEIRAVCKVSGIDETVADQFIDAGIGLDAVRSRVFEIMKERNKAAGIGGQPAGVPATATTPEAKKAALEAEARKAYDEGADVYKRTGVKFDEHFIKTFQKEKEGVFTA